ncbi:TCP-1/cpn60 chaperonin family protein [Halobellus sp. EA9]|uniref:TCP-1/cpn60 chaperonin family protein n=1 Tax=Halobellus sp. EA9 TaxID=3421647 RepID=UPI003EBC8A3A
MDARADKRDLGPPEDQEWIIQDKEVREYVRESTHGVGSIVRSSLGPESLEKMIRTRDYQDRPETVITADADQIIDAIHRGDGFNDPVAALFIDSVDAMQRSLGDGTATSVILAEALVDRGLDLIDSGIHPNTVVSGYAIAASHTGDILDDLARECAPTDQEILEHVARTAMTDTLSDDVRSDYARYAAETVGALASATDGAWLDTEMIDVRAVTDLDQELYQGVIASRRPIAIEEDERSHTDFDWTPSIEGVRNDVTVALLDQEITVAETTTPTTEDRATSPGQLTRDRNVYQQRCEELARNLAESGVDILVSQDRIDVPIQKALANAGVTTIDGVKYPKEDIHRLAEATGGAVMSSLSDLSLEVLGTAGSVREIVREDEKWTIFAECEGTAFTLVIPVGLDSTGRRHERIVSKAIEVGAVAAMDKQVLPGAGAPASSVIRSWRQDRWSVPDRTQLAVTEYTNALEDYLRILARNAGLDPIDTVATLTAAEDGRGTGIDLDTGAPLDPWEEGIIEPRRVFSQAIETARAITEQLLTLDAIFYPDVDLSQFTPVEEHE